MSNHSSATAAGINSVASYAKSPPMDLRCPKGGLYFSDS